MQIRNQIHIRNGKIYSVNKIIELVKDFTTIEINISKLKLDLNEPLWKDEASQPIVKYSMNDILEYKDSNSFFKNHYKRVIKSDLNIPIIIDKHYIIIDGYHRVLKAITVKKTTILCKQIEKLPKMALINIEVEQ